MVVGAMAEPPVLPQQPERFGPRHLRAGPGSLCRASVPAAQMKAAEEQFLHNLVGSGAPKGALAAGLWLLVACWCLYVVQM